MVVYDLVIIGGGPAGLSAAIYAARQKINFIVLTGNIGGQTLWSTEVENYLGFHTLSGEQLVEKFQEHLKEYKIEVREQEPVEAVKKKGKNFELKTKKGTYQTKTVIIASGKQPRHLNVPGEKELYGKGVTYCATCDAPLYKGKTVAVIGGGNSAIEAAMILEKYAKKIYMLVWGDKIQGEPVLLDKLKAMKNLEIITKADTKAITGDKFVKGIEYEHNKEKKSLKTDGVFIEIGLIPNTQFIDIVEKNDKGEIIANKEMQTSVPGIFAAGDVNDGVEKQIIVAAGEGCVALLEAVRYLQKLK
ncbi:FAD-dependent oxidoreductase [Candidatus Woesearchaeota archaeon]|nr:FAD-dependent oxidoreductase [Candidatus Woesearchaeota archaeon]MBW3005766.1 FAD-dependent oxidoreductase [Candidatus Woesearchaeota archaeon]